MTSLHLAFLCLLSTALAWVWTFALVMRRIALYGLFLLVAGTSQAATYRLTGQQVTATLPDGGMNWYVLIYNTSHQIVGEASWTPYTSAVTRSGTLSTGDRSSDFYVVVAGAFNNYNSPSLVKLAWYSAYEVGGTEPQSSTFGGFSNGSPVSLSGAPANPLLGTSTPPKYWREVVDLDAPAAGQPALRYQIVVSNASTSAVIGRHVVVVPPGPTAQVVLYYNVQFTYTVQATQQVNTSAGEKGWMPTGPVLKSGTGDPETNDPPQGAFPEGLGPMGPSGGGSGSMAGGSGGSGSTLPGSPDTTKVANEARTGTPDPNEEARQKELRGEIQRGTNQTKASGDQVAGAVGEAADKITEAIKAGNGTSQGTSTGSGIDQGGAVGTADAGVVAFLSSIPGRITALGTALTNLRNAAGLTNVGTQTPSWVFTYGTHSATLNLNYDFTMVRALALFATGLGAIWQAIGIIRGTFADEGK